MSLIYNQKFNNESININLNLTNIDHLEILSSGFTNCLLSSNPGINLYFNNDYDFKNYKRIYQYGGTSHNSSVDNHPIQLGSSSCDSKWTSNLILFKEDKIIHQIVNQINITSFYNYIFTYQYLSDNIITSLQIIASHAKGHIKIINKI